MSSTATAARVRPPRAAATATSPGHGISGVPPRRADPGPVPAASTARAIVEVLAGQRSPTQLSRVTTPSIHALITQRAVTAARRARGPLRPALVRRVLVCEPAPGVAEIAAVVQQAKGRVRAMALRMEIRQQRWVVTQVTIG